MPQGQGLDLLSQVTASCLEAEGTYRAGARLGSLIMPFLSPTASQDITTTKTCGFWKQSLC